MEKLKIPKWLALESEIILNTKINNSTKLLYAFIATFANNEKGYTYISNRKLSEYMNCSTRQIIRNLNSLEENKYIKIKYKNGNRVLIPTINEYLNYRKQKIQNIQEQYNEEYDWLSDTE